MKKFLKKYYLLFVFIILVVLVSALFNSKNANFNSVASILSAQQLLAQNRGQLSNFSMQQKEDLIKKIDAESQSLAGPHNTLNREVWALKDEKTKLNQEIQKINSDIASVNTQISAANTRINSLKASQQSTNQRHKDKNRQCNSLKGPQLQNCRNQLKNISNSLNSIKNQVAQAQNSIAPLTQRLSPFQNSLSQVNSRISLLNTQISAKEMEFRKIDALLNSLRDFRKVVVDSTSDPKDEEQPISGCTDGQASNWNSMATKDDGSCDYEIKGCTDPSANNYNQMATKDDGSCTYDRYCECEGEEGGEENDIEKITKVKVYITKFGGPDDKDMGKDETLSVTKGLARELKPEEIYTAWPMPDNGDGSLNAPLGLPSVDKCFGPEENSWPKGTGDERVDAGNKALNDRYAEISHTGPNGIKVTIRVKIVDRGPEERDRWDGSPGLWKALGLEKQMNDGPEKSDAVELEVRLVPKNAGLCPIRD